MGEAQRFIDNQLLAAKKEKYKMNLVRCEQVNKIIAAGVAALQQRQEFTSETQTALNWLRKLYASEDKEARP